jgi:nucleotide-binding universal stress UspA family protein
MDTPKQRTVLVPLDGSPLAERALPLATRFASALGAHLELLRVVLADQPATSDEAAAGYLDGLAAAIGRDGLSVSTHVLRGNAAECIVREATAYHVDLTVLSTHARAGVDRALRGSVAAYVVAHVAAPIAVVRAGDHRGDRLSTLLLAIEPSSGAPLAATIELARATGAHVVLLTVIRQEAVYVWQWQAGDLLDEPQAVVAARQELEALAAHMREAGVTTEVQVAIGPTVASIQSVAEAVDADLVIMSTHARTGVQRALLGSTADSVLHVLDRPVLLFRLHTPDVTPVRPIDIYHVIQHQKPRAAPPTIAEPLDHVRHESALPRWRHLPEAVSTET